MERVWATIFSQDAYLPGAHVLAHCLEVVKSSYPLVVLGTPSLSQQSRTLLARVGIPYVERTGLYPSREQHDLRNADAQRRHLNEGLCCVREHLGWFRVKGRLLLLCTGRARGCGRFAPQSRYLSYQPYGDVSRWLSHSEMLLRILLLVIQPHYAPRRKRCR